MESARIPPLTSPSRYVQVSFVTSDQGLSSGQLFWPSLQSFEDVLGKVNRFHGKHLQYVVRIAGDSGAQFPHQHER